jgi:hypothetical protein
VINVCVIADVQLAAFAPAQALHRLHALRAFGEQSFSLRLSGHRFSQRKTDTLFALDKSRAAMNKGAAS